MARYLVTYDLKNPGKDYPALTKELERFGARRVLRSSWVVENDATAENMRDHFWKFLDSNDRLLVVDFTNMHWASNRSIVDI
jgi:hypothetical protein